MTQRRSIRDEPEGPLRRLDSRPPAPGRGRPSAASGSVPVPRTVPERRRPDAGSLRMLALFTGIASASALAAAMLPSVAPATDAGVGSPPTTDPAGIADAPAPSVRHVKRYVVLKPGQTPPPNAHVLVRPTPTPRVTVVTRTRQSGKP